MEGLLKDLRHSVRMLWRAPVFTVTAVATLGLGIAANTAIFSVVNAVLLKPLPYPDPDRIVMFESAQLSPAKFNVWREETNVFQDLSAYRFGDLNVTGSEHLEQVRVAFVSAGYFRLFGQLVARGRTFTANEDRPDGGRVVVVSDAFWKWQFRDDPWTTGKVVSFDGRPYEVIGVMPPGVEKEAPDDLFRAFSGMRPIDVWVPIQIDPDSRDQNVYFSVAARLKPGVSLATADAQFQVVMGELRRRFPLAEPPRAVPVVQPIGDLLSHAPLSLAILSGAVVLVLLIACANVANLLLIRATSRKREVAIRTAIGAGRGIIFRQLLTESALLSLTGGGLGLVLGMFGIRALLALDTVSYARIGDHGSAVTVDWRVLSFTIVLSLATSVLFGLVPAIEALQVDLSEALKEGSERSGTGRRQNRVRSSLVVTEVALAGVLLLGAGLLIRTFVALHSINPGFDARHVLTMRISLTGQRFQKSAGVAELASRTVQQIGNLPGVEAAATTCCLPLEDRILAGVVIVGRPLHGRSHGSVNISTITPRYFEVFKIPILRGRTFTEHDRSESASAAIISSAAARKFWPYDDPTGAAMKGHLVFPDMPGREWQIVGIAADVKADGLRANAPPVVYLPLAQAPEDLNAYLVRRPMAWVVRTQGEPHGIRSAIQSTLQKGSGLPAFSLRWMNEIRSRSIAGQEFNMLLLSIFGLSALLLAAIGIYGLMAYSVQQRKREIGVRIALGAEARQILRMVISQGMRLAAAGVLVSLVAAFAFGRLMASFLFGVKPLDPMVFAAVPIVMGGVAFFAVSLSARKASRIDPIEALRHE